MPGLTTVTFVDNRPQEPTLAIRPLQAPGGRFHGGEARMKAGGGGVAAAVAGRDADRTEQWASDNGVERAVTGYQALIDDPDIDVLYIPLPNALHAEWTIRALEAGKPVLCEKPLCGTLRDAQRVLAAARQTGTLLWEAFVFPFQPQMAAIEKLVADGAIGELKEIKS